MRTVAAQGVSENTTKKYSSDTFPSIFGTMSVCWGPRFLGIPEVMTSTLDENLALEGLTASGDRKEAIGDFSNFLRGTYGHVF